ncbi:MAG: DUF2892 domain-containing protein [Neomegalonema sp.]|nr:DUF2892 domain-containing protein [Neomegalonema sp.]
MTANVGSLDRIVRIILGAALVALVFVGDKIAPDFKHWYLGWIGIVPIATAFISFCPLYRIFGIRTCRISR